MKSKLPLLTAAIVIAYVILAGCQLGQPFVDDETWEFFAAKTLVETGSALQVTGEDNVYHPHGYYYLLGVFFRALGSSETAARWVGLLATLTTFLIMRGVLRRLVRCSSASTPPVNRSLDESLGARLDFWLAAFYLFSPAVIQGSLIITADTALHQLTTVGMLAWVIHRQPMVRSDFIVLGLLFAGALWIKIVTPCLVLLGIGIFFLTQRDLKRFWSVSLWSVGIGIGLFSISWHFYCQVLGNSGMTAVEYILSVSRSRTDVPSIAFKAIWLARMAVVVALWVGIPMCLLLLGSWRRRWRRSLDPGVTLLLVVATLLSIVYTFIAGASYGFPRYHFAILPVFALLAAARIGTSEATLRTPKGLFVTGVLGTAAFLILCVPDPLRLVNYDLKLAQLAMSDFGLVSMKFVALGLTLTLVPIAVAAIAWPWVARLSHAPKREALLPLLAATTLGGFLALNWIQVRAPYHTHLSYGESGTAAVHEFVRARVRADGQVVAGKDIVYHTTQSDFMHDYRWTEPEFLLGRIQSPTTQFFILGVNHNTIQQLRLVHDDSRFQDALAKYERHRIGSYVIWERPPISPEASPSTSPSLNSSPAPAPASFDLDDAGSPR